MYVVHNVSRANNQYVFVGIFTTLEKAKKAAQTVLANDPGVLNCDIYQQDINMMFKDIIVGVMYNGNTWVQNSDWKEPKQNPIEQFTDLLLENDPIAMDMVRDVLKI